MPPRRSLVDLATSARQQLELGRHLAAATMGGRPRRRLRAWPGRELCHQQGPARSQPRVADHTVVDACARCAVPKASMTRRRTTRRTSATGRRRRCLADVLRHFSAAPRRRRNLDAIGPVLDQRQPVAAEELAQARGDGASESSCVHAPSSAVPGAGDHHRAPASRPGSVTARRDALVRGTRPASPAVRSWRISTACRAGRGRSCEDGHRGRRVRRAAIVPAAPCGSTRPLGRFTTQNFRVRYFERTGATVQVDSIPETAADARGMSTNTARAADSTSCGPPPQRQPCRSGPPGWCGRCAAIGLPRSCPRAAPPTPRTTSHALVLGQSSRQG